MVSICKRKERYKTIRFQENANRKIRDYKINEFLKFLKLLHKDSVSHDIKDLLVMAISLSLRTFHPPALNERKSKSQGRILKRKKGLS